FLLTFVFFHRLGDHRYLPSVPTRRSSDLESLPFGGNSGVIKVGHPADIAHKPVTVDLGIGRFPGFVGIMQIRFIQIARLHAAVRSEEHTSELQSRENLVCRLLLEKKNNTK